MQTRFNWRHQYDEDRDEYEGLAAAIECLDESLAIQNAPDADLNEIIRRFGLNDGSVLPANLGVTDPKYYGDFSDIPDLREALHRLHDAEDKFSQLPADIRKRFDNDPIALYEWVSDKDNHDEAVKLKLLKTSGSAAPISDPASPGTRDAGITKPEA